MRLIDADALPKYTGYALSADEVAMAVENAPTIDAVPLEQYQSMEATCVKLQKAIADTPQVVRCKDCRYYQDNNNGYPHNECRWRTDETPDATDWGLEHDFENHGWDMDRTVKACLHMVGHGRSKEYYRHGKRYMKAYRNYWYGKMRDDFEYMRRKTFGYMERTVPSDDGYVYYSLTEEGLKWLGRKTKMIIKETD